MRHFDLWQWADFARGLTEPALQAAMAAHLSGCVQCQQHADMLRAVDGAARADAQYEPPAYAIRLAEAVYPYAPPEKSRLRKLVARLIHDSALEPLPAGIRNEERRMSRRALYEAGGYHLDLQLELEPARGVVTLVGQLADRIQPSTSTAEVPVWLMEREHLVESTACNDLGEFQLEYAHGRRVRLFVPLPEAGKRLEIPLSRLTPGGTRRSGVRKSQRRKSIETGELR